jgi:hypothetical protein
MITQYCLKGKDKITPGGARRDRIDFHYALKGPNNCRALSHPLVAVSDLRLGRNEPFVAVWRLPGKKVSRSETDTNGRIHIFF